MASITRVVPSMLPVGEVADYLSDFTTTAQWDPHTASCERMDDGPISVGSRFRNTQQVGRFTTSYDYRVTSFDPGRYIELHAESRAARLTDTMRFEGTPGGGSCVTYTATVELK